MSLKQAFHWIIYFPVGLFAASAGRQPPHMGGGSQESSRFFMVLEAELMILAGAQIRHTP